MRIILPNWLITISSLVSSTRLMPVTLTSLRAVFNTGIPKMESLKNKSGKSSMFFEPRKLIVNLPASTSNPPQLHHQNTRFYHPFFAKTPAEIRSHHPTTTENAPGMFQNPIATKFLWRTQPCLNPTREYLNAHSAVSRDGLPYRRLSFEDRSSSD